MITEIPLLQNVRVAKPCHASWDDMHRVDGNRVRFCDGCQKRVYNLSEMGQAEAEGLLRAHEGHLCVRYYRRHDGTILTSDCPVGLRAARDMFLTRARVSAGLCFMLCVAFAAYRVSNHPADVPADLPKQTIPGPIEPLMGAVAPKVEVKPETGHFTTGIVAPPPQVPQGEMGTMTMGKPVAPTRMEMGDIAIEPPTQGRAEIGEVGPNDEVTESPTTEPKAMDAPLSARQEIGFDR